MTQPQSPRVSVVTAWYNRPDSIAETLASILNQNFEGFEYIVVNDGSTDPRTRAALEAFDHPALRVIHQDNTGFVGAIRRAVDAARAPFVAVQGAGDVARPDRLRLQHAFLEARPDFAAAGCGYVNTVVGGEWDGSEMVITSDKDEVHLANFHNANPFSHGEVMFRKSAYDAVGGYRAFFRFAQDRDLWLRLLDTHRLGRIPDVLYDRRIFMSDGVGGQFSKTIEQAAFARIADTCQQARAAGRPDPVDAGQITSFMDAPRDKASGEKVVSNMHRAMRTGSVALSDLSKVGRVFGWPIYAYTLQAWLRRRLRAHRRTGF